MQNKGAIKLFGIILALVCFYQLTFTYCTRQVEKQAKEYANSTEVQSLAKELSKGNIGKETFLKDSIISSRERYYLDSVASEPTYNLLIKKYTYQECKERELNLGLDLKGGMNVTMEVSIVDIVKVMSNNSKDITFNKAITRAVEMQSETRYSGKDFVTLFATAFNEIDPNAKLSSIFSTMELKDKISYNSTNEDVIKVIRLEAEGAIDRTFNILRTRIDRFGVTQPNIQKLQSTGRILIELPGVKEPERVRKLLQGTAMLEFWETYDFAELYQNFADANKFLNSVNKTDSETLSTDSLNTGTDSTINASTDTSVSSLEQKLGESSKTPKDITNMSAEDKEMNDYSKENPLFAVLRPNLTQDSKTGNYMPGNGPVVGYVAIKDTSKVNKYLRINNIKNLFPRNLKLAWTIKPYDKEGKYVQLIALKITSRDGSAPLGGDVITDARQDMSQNQQNEISMSMNNEGARIWKRLTSENIGKSIAIVLDDYVYSFPTVQNEIPNGRSSITGQFDLNEAKDLANVLKAGKLPAPARIVEEAIVGPSLGRETINTGIISFIIAFFLVVIFMGLYYNTGGWVANIALLANVFLMMGILASLGAVLTLPGIAGIVLTLGMAVDANIIIYERMREELAEGKGMRLAIEDGYKHSYSAIIDSNVTTILSAIVLYIFGSGPVQGFATTLIIGILTTLFTALLLSRLIFEWMLNRNMNIKVDNKFTANAYKKIRLDFLKNRKVYYVISSILIVISLTSIFTRGFNLGVDFTGGRTYIVRFHEDVKSSELASHLSRPLSNAEVKTFGSNNQMKITTKYLINDNSIDADNKVEQTLINSLNENPIYAKSEIMSSQKVGPTVAADMIYKAIWSILLAIIIIFLYIFIRFNSWKYAIGAIGALVHDTTIVIGAYSLFYSIMPFSLEVDLSFIAAILTVVGFSINDTVIIFDRIREHLDLHKKESLYNNINNAINATLSRTINTVLTVLLVLATIFFFGSEVIRGFIFAMLLGMIVGTYSSICNASPISYDIIMWLDKKKKGKELSK
ncbi:MAG: protein translocase subunit SecDF [Bacteroidetes bacterium GWE2_29_8]|nr:MAG: protein translocase subunit SecDF [Bacteroidetes bacterium GWE2_29_8]OFY18358.1 MAG: protein translocase subunit SecDF [Bacteroidetes bacterium GWF2_29_10]